MVSNTRMTEIRRLRKRTKLGKKRKKKIRKFGTTPPKLPTK